MYRSNHNFWLLYRDIGGPLDDTDMEGTAEAEQAAARAHDTTDEPDVIVDALEAAEAKYAKDHPEEAARPGTVIFCTLFIPHLPVTFPPKPDVQGVMEIIARIEEARMPSTKQRRNVQQVLSWLVTHDQHVQRKLRQISPHIITH